MAKAEKDDAAEGAPAKAKGGGMGAIIGIVLATLLAGGAGAGYAFFMQKKQAAPAAQPKEDKKDAKDHGPEKEQDIAGLLALQPIITNLAAPAGIWIRLESSVVIDKMPAKEADVLRKEITEDVHAFLRTLTLPQVEGAMGLLHLKEDINERLAVRGKGKAKEIIIHMMVLQ